MQVPFVGPSYESRSPDADIERTVNWYPEVMEAPNGKTKAALYPTPGYTLFATLPELAISSMYAVSGRCFVQAGTNLYELYATGGFQLRGAMTGITPGLSTMCSSGITGNELFVTVGGRGYLLNLTLNTFTQVYLDADVSTPLPVNFCGYLDGYFLALDTATSTLYLSGLLDGATWDSLNKAQRLTASDPWIGMVVSSRQAHLFGSLTTESWYDSGNPDFPLEPVQGSLITDGIAAPSSSVALVDNSRIWLTNNVEGTGVVKRAEGYQATRISNHAMERAIQGYPVSSDAKAWSYQEDGHTFYVLTFPTGRATWVYDTTTQLWHERGWWDIANVRFDAAKGACHAFAFGKHLVGRADSGELYVQSLDVSLDMGGTRTRRLRQGPHLCNNSGWMYFPEIRLIMETGVGTIADPDPQVMLQWSDDGGHTWSDEHWRSAGAVGEYGKNIIWRRCGRSRDRVMRVVTDADAPMRILGMEVGTEN
jgi:hypothetical protein